MNYCITFFVLLLSVLALNGYSQDTVYIGSISEIKGSSVTSRDGEELKISTGFQIKSGDTIKTGTSSLIKTEFIDGSSIVIGPDSELSITEFVYDKEKRITNYNLDKGNLKSNISNRADRESSVKINSKDISASIETALIYLDSNKGMFAVESGEANLKVTDDPNNYKLSKNQYLKYINGTLTGPADTTGIIWSNFDNLTALSLNLNNENSFQSFSDLNYELKEGAIAIITLVKGDVTVVNDDEEIKAVEGLNVFMGNYIETGDDSLVRINFIDDSVMALADNAYLELTKFIFDPDKRVNKSRLLKGKMKSFTKKYLDKNSSVEIETKNAVAGVKGTILYVDSDNELFGVETGEVFVKGFEESEDGGVTLKSGEYTTVPDGVASVPKTMTGAVWKPFNVLLDVPVVNKVPLIKGIINMPKKLIKKLPFF